MDMKNDPELEDMVQFLAKVLETALVIQMWNEIYEGMWELMLKSLPTVVKIDASTKNHIETLSEVKPLVRLYAHLAPNLPMFRLFPAALPSSNPSCPTT